MSSDEIELIKQILNTIQICIDTINMLLKPKDDNPENEPYLIAIKDLISKLKSGFAKTSLIYNNYTDGMIENSTKLITMINGERILISEDIQHLKDKFDALQKKNEAITDELDTFPETTKENTEIDLNDDMNPTYPLVNQSIIKKLENNIWEVLKKSNTFLSNNNCNINHDSKRYEFILKYINDDDTLLEDLKNMEPDKKKEFVNDLDSLKLPIKMKYVNQLYYNNDKFVVKAWNDKMVTFINDQDATELNTYLNEKGLTKNLLHNNSIECNKNMNTNLIICMNIKLKYLDIIKDYCCNDVMNPDLLTKIDLNYDDIITEMNTLGIIVNESKIIEAWKKNRYIYINNKYNENIDKWIKKLPLFKEYYDNNNYKQIADINTESKSVFIYINIKLKYFKFIENYFQTYEIDEKLLREDSYKNNLEELENELKKIGKEFDENDRKRIKHEVINPSIVLKQTQIVDNIYDMYILDWLGSNTKWKLIYRASEHEYTAKSFHKYCDNQGPTLILIKSEEGYIFGGFTKKNWSSEFIKIKDVDAFVFTLRNPFDVKPTKFDVLSTSRFAISCDINRGPIFYGNNYDGCTIYIGDECNKQNSCSCNSQGKNDGYECNSEHLSSLFVNTAGPKQNNYFSVDDYEVYTIDK